MVVSSSAWAARKVVMRTLDSFAFADVALLKVDAEGAEPLVLWGAREVIRRCRPLILFAAGSTSPSQCNR
jgi:FkbM family methyltransferase